MTSLLLGVRAHIDRHSKPPKRQYPQRPWCWPRYVIVFDTETTTDAAQRFLYGWFRVLRTSVTGAYDVILEGMIHADDLAARDPDGYATLATYARTHRAEVSEVEDAIPEVILCSRAEFAEFVLYKYGYVARALIVGFNLPFDLSRIAVRARRGRKKFRDGFTLVFKRYRGKDGRLHDDKERPCIRIKSVSNASAFIEFTRPRLADSDRWEERQDGPDEWSKFTGHFLDLRTHLFAMTDQKFSLDSAAATFLGERKERVRVHGVITPEHVAYGRHDVRLTHRLFEYAKAEWSRLPVDLDPCKAYSPASVAKAHLAAMGIASPRTKWGRKEPFALYGLAMGAYFGGRAGVFVRHTPVPVVYCDFQSMYPTCFTLMGLGRWLIAESYEVEDCTADAQALLERVSLDGCFDPALWPQLAFFGEFQPDDDLLPVRYPYDDPPQQFGIGFNHVRASFPLTVAGPDIVANVLRTGRIPVLQRAVRIVAKGVQRHLTPITLPNGVVVDPRADDFFRTIVEQRLSLKPLVDDTDAQRTVRALKIIANSGTYGIFAEVRPEDVADPEEVTVYGARSAFTTKSKMPEQPGPFYFPPIAAIVTAAARLMLTLGESMVGARGGAIAMCDTDSLAIIATPQGGATALHHADGSPVRALSSDDVRAIVERFRALSPYRRDVLKGSILDVTKENFRNGVPEPLTFLGVSAKRYVLYRRGGDNIEIVAASEHGLGQYLSPHEEPEDEDENRDRAKPWVEAIWLQHIHRVEGLPHVELPFADLPALTRIAVTTPGQLAPFAIREAGLPYDDAMKPFNFLLSANRLPGAPLPIGTDPERFHLVRAYETDRAQWLTGEWFDIHTGDAWRVTTSLTPDPSHQVALRTYGFVADAHFIHAESKSAGADGQPCGPHTRGLLAPRHIVADDYRLLGKEANKLVTVEKGLEHRYTDVQAIYVDPTHDAFAANYVARLRTIRPRRRVARAAGVSERAIRDILSGASTARPHIQARLIAFLNDLAAQPTERPPRAREPRRRSRRRQRR